MLSPSGLLVSETSRRAQNEHQESILGRWLNGGVAKARDGIDPEGMVEVSDLGRRLLQLSAITPRPQHPRPRGRLGGQTAKRKSPDPPCIWRLPPTDRSHRRMLLASDASRTPRYPPGR